jgi:hypothetical protein
VGGKYTLTAFIAIALADYGGSSPAALNSAVQYLVDNMTTVWDDAYALAVTSLALARINNPACDDVLTRLLEIAIKDGYGMHWQPHDIETTAYVALAMIEREMAQANEAIKWLSLQQNGQGGFGHTQDTVMALKALMTAARAQTRNVNLELTATASDGAVVAQFTVDSSNFDVLQIAKIDAGADIVLRASGSGEVLLDLTVHPVGYSAIAIFVVAYLVVMAEEFTHLRKSKPVLLAAGIIWGLIGWVYAGHGLTHAAEEAVRRATDSVDFANSSGECFERKWSVLTLAAIEHQAGNRDRALTHVRGAE